MFIRNERMSGCMCMFMPQYAHLLSARSDTGTDGRGLICRRALFRIMDRPEAGSCGLSAFLCNREELF